MIVMVVAEQVAVKLVVSVFQVVNYSGGGKHCLETGGISGV